MDILGISFVVAVIVLTGMGIRYVLARRTRVEHLAIVTSSAERLEESGLNAFDYKFGRFVYPAYEEPLLTAFGAEFECAFVLLHPFLAASAKLDLTEDYPGEQEIAEGCRKLEWKSVAEASGLGSIAKVNQALLTSILALKVEYCDYAARDALHRFLTDQTLFAGVWMPGEGRFEPLLCRDFLSAFRSKGFDQLIYVPELPEIDGIEQIELSHLETGLKKFPFRGSLVAPDCSFLFTVDWDSFFTLFFGSREFVEGMVVARNLEGFFVSPTTQHRWSFEPVLPEH